MIIALKIAYDGSDFCGWQVQPNGISVQGEIQNALSLLLEKPVTVIGSGRTDAGVHALGQVASFEIEDCSIPPEKFASALNARLPYSIRIMQSWQEKEGFNALKSAKRKTYRYSFYYSKVENPLLERYNYNLDSAPDLDLIKLASKLFIGEHDFKCFNASGSGAKTTVRTIFSIDLVSTEKGFDFYVCGNGFLYNMVRTMAGTLLEVGQGKKTVLDIEKMLKSGDRSLCGRTLPAKALTLMSVEY